MKITYKKNLFQNDKYHVFIGDIGFTFWVDKRNTTPYSKGFWRLSQFIVANWPDTTNKKFRSAIKDAPSIAQLRKLASK